MDDFSDLVHRVIALSGSATAGWAIHRHGTSNWSAENLAAYLRCEKQIDENDINDLLRATGVSIGDHCNLQETITDCLVVCLFIFFWNFYSLQFKYLKLFV